METRNISQEVIALMNKFNQSMIIMVVKDGAPFHTMKGLFVLRMSLPLSFYGKKWIQILIWIIYIPLMSIKRLILIYQVNLKVKFHILIRVISYLEHLGEVQHLLPCHETNLLQP